MDVQAVMYRFWIEDCTYGKGWFAWNGVMLGHPCIIGDRIDKPTPFYSSSIFSEDCNTPSKYSDNGDSLHMGTVCFLAILLH